MSEEKTSFLIRLGDRIRNWLRHRPVLYALIGAVGIVLVWKGVEDIASYFPFLFGPGSFILGVLILLATGLLISFFTGDTILISGQKSEKKLAEKTESEVRTEEEILPEIVSELDTIKKDIEELHRTTPPSRS